MRAKSEQFLILDLASGVNDASIMATCKHYKVAKFSVVVAGSWDGTLKFYGSDSDARADLNASASETNQFTPVEVLDYDSGNSSPGSTGLDFNSAPYNADGVYNFEVQSNGLSQVGVKTDSASQGTIKVYITFYDDSDK